MKTTLTVLAGALLLAMGGAVNAQDTGTSQSVPATTTQSTDSLTQDPAVSGVGQEQLDQDSMAPVDPTMDPVAQSEPEWNRLDTDGDGTLSEAEIQADVALSGVADTYDTDGDGQLTRAEFDSYLDAGATDGLTAGAETDVDSDLDGTVDSGLDADLTAGSDTEFEVEDDLEDE